MPSDYKQHDVPAVLDTIVNLFPHNIADSWANNQVVPIVLFAILTALAYNAAASTDKGCSAVAPFKTFIDAGNVVFSKATQIVDMGRTALNVAGAANTAVIVAQTEHQLDTDLYYGRKEYSDDLNDDEQFGQTSTQSLTGTGPSQRTNITNDAKFDSANVSQQQSGFTLNFAPNAVLSASSDDVCCGTKPNK